VALCSGKRCYITSDDCHCTLSHHVD